ncbi:MAG: hypothetical protein AAGG44_11475 [Planctomycetota bacterium]
MGDSESSRFGEVRERFGVDELSGLAPRLEGLEGWEQFVDGQLWAAYRAVAVRVSEDESNGRAWELLGLVFRDLAKPKSAMNAFERAGLLVPLHAFSSICLAECYAAVGKARLARDLYLSQVEDLDVGADLLLLIASGLEAIDEPHLAMETCRKASYLDPDSGQPHYDMSYYATKCGAQLTLVESLAWRAIELDPTNVHFRVGLASLLIRLKRPQKAHWVIARLEERQFSEITCECCLGRLKELYLSVADVQRSRWCEARLCVLAGLGDGQST